MGTKTNTNTKKKPSYAAQRLVDLGTEANAAGNKNVARVIFLVTGDQEHPDNVNVKEQKERSDRDLLLPDR